MSRVMASKLVKRSISRYWVSVILPRIITTKEKFSLEVNASRIINEHLNAMCASA